MDLDAAYAACAEVTKREAKNFYYAFLSLPRAQRQAVYALYAFCRESDDVADAPKDDAHLLTENRGADRAENETGAPILLGQSGDVADEPTVDVRPLTEKQDAACAPQHEAGAMLTEKRGDAALLLRADGADRETGAMNLARKREGLARLRERLSRAAAGDPEDGRDLALADAIARFGVDPDDLSDLITGMEMDLTLSRIETDEELERYCYHVASAVGLATLPILNDGTPPTDAMREAAIDLGLGMQWVNILRDVAEDLDRDRIYLSREAFHRHGIDERVLQDRRVTDTLRALFAEHADKARALLESGRRLLPMLPRCGRMCPWLLSEIYGRILERIVASGYDVFSGRVSLPKAEKIGLLLSTIWRRR